MAQLRLILILLFLSATCFGQTKFPRGAIVGGGTPIDSITLTTGAIVHDGGVLSNRFSRIRKGFVLDGISIDRIIYTSGEWVWELGSSSAKKLIVDDDGIQFGNGCIITSVHVTAGLVDSLYVGGTGYSFGELLDAVELQTLVTLQADTVPLVTFGGGGGQLADVEIFTTTAIYGNPWNSGSDTLIITSLKGIIATGEGISTIGVQIWWNDSLKTSTAAKLNTDPFTINNKYAGNEDVSFLNSEIPPNVYIWCTSPTISVGTRPSYLSITLTGHKRNYSY